MVRPQAHHTGQHVNRIVVLHDGPNPSTDFYLRSRLAAPGMPPVDYIDISAGLPRMASIQLDTGGVFVIVCRYIRAGWLELLEAMRPQLAGLAYFVDDDLPAMLTDSTLPLRYRFRIWQRYARHVDRLSALTSQLWVATPVLEEKYRDLGAILLPPLYINNPPEDEQVIRYFYHGTASHEAEKHFLVEVVRQVQLRDSRMLFEITGDNKTRELFRGIERVIVLHPMDWRTYLAYTGTTRQDIGLAPLFETPVNTARSHSKVYDITRSGAVGIYSDRVPYAGYIRDGEDGLLLPDDTGQWVEAVLGLAASAGQRRAMALAGRARCPVADDSIRGLVDLRQQDGGEQIAGRGSYL